jgi:hypothetical protein
MTGANENVLTLAITGTTIVGLWVAGAGGHSFWALVMLLNLNSVTQRRRSTDSE